MPSSTSATVTKTPKQRKSAATKNSGKESAKDAAPADANDFFWTYTEEPHRTRRIAIIKSHPEV